jgi:hypothetical protein
MWAKADQQEQGRQSGFGGKKTKESHYVIILHLPPVVPSKWGGHPSPFVGLFCSFGQATKKRKRKE